MKPIVIVSPRICKALSVFINVGAITLYPFIISREKMDKQLLNHEMIHIKQQEELFVIGFYLLYGMWWLQGILKGMSSAAAYYAIPFEVEAYVHDENMKYLKNRKRWAWKKYI